MNERLRRSVLYMPAANARALEKAKSLPLDGLIADLEDGVAPHMKDTARDIFRAAVAAGGYGHREVLLRLNPLTSEWAAGDVRLAAETPIDGVVLTKVNGAADVLEAIAALDRAGARPDLPVWAMAETPRAILDIDAICGAHRRLAGIILGTNDLVFEMRARLTPGREGVLPALSRCVLAARTHGIEVLDGVFLGLDDPAGFMAECEQGRTLGFDGKTLIHPSQIETTNRVFAPSAEDLAWAQRVIDAWDAALAAGKGVAVVDGRFIENLHMYEARRMLARDQAINARRA